MNRDLLKNMGWVVSGNNTAKYRNGGHDLEANQTATLADISQAIRNKTAVYPLEGWGIVMVSPYHIMHNSGSYGRHGSMNFVQKYGFSDVRISNKHDPKKRKEEKDVVEILREYFGSNFETNVVLRYETNDQKNETEIDAVFDMENYLIHVETSTRLRPIQMARSILLEEAYGKFSFPIYAVYSKRNHTLELYVPHENPFMFRYEHFSDAKGVKQIILSMFSGYHIKEEWAGNVRFSVIRINTR